MIAISTDPHLQLLARYRATGDPQAFAALVERYQRLVRAAGMRTGGSALADDIAQETFLRLANLRDGIHTSLASWLYRTAEHVGLDLARSEAARKRRELAVQIEVDRDVPMPDAPTEAAESRGQLDRILSELPANDRDIIISRYQRGQPLEEIALGAGISRQVMRERLAGILDRLRRSLRRSGDLEIV